MADQHWRGGGSSGSGGRDHKENSARQGNAPRSVERPPSATRNAASPVANGPVGPQLRTFLDAFTIGRSRRCDLVIPTSEDTRTISKTHARIFPLRDGEVTGLRARPGARHKWILQDLNTLNGTAINGMDLMPGGSMELHDGDELVLSSNMRTGMRLHIQIPDADQSRLVAMLYGPNNGQRPQQVPPSFGGTPTWRGAPLPTRGFVPPAPSPSSVYDTLQRFGSVSSLSKRQRSTDERTASRHSSNGQDAAAATHNSKRSRRDESDDKERLMLCPVCLDYFYNSATLACSHTFCGHCISHWFRTCSSLSCPECRSGVKHIPVRNRALDDLVRNLVGESDAYRTAARKRTTEERVGASASNGLDLRTHPLIFTRWSPDNSVAFSAFIGKQFGDHRVAACRQVGLTEAAIDGASAAELLLAAQNLLIDCMSLRASNEACDRLKIYLHYG